jgi:redox-sensing transcriptional repressor
MIKRGSLSNAKTDTDAEDVLDFPSTGDAAQTSASTYNDVSIPRLYAYHRALAQAGSTGQATITSHALAELLGNTIAPAQIRRDLSTLGTLGRRGHGYAINPLVEQLAWVLGLEHDWRIAIVGFGYLGHAFATFITARERRFRVTAIFDNSPAVIGQQWQGITVCDVAEMENVLTAASLCNIGVIAVPADAAQSCAQRFADLGIRAILNFAPASLTVPRSVVLRNIDLAGEMSILTHHLAATTDTKKALG